MAELKLANIQSTINYLFGLALRAYDEISEDNVAAQPLLPMSVVRSLQLTRGVVGHKSCISEAIRNAVSQCGRSC
jgi:hypothetical protein